MIFKAQDSATLLNCKDVYSDKFDLPNKTGWGQFFKLDQAKQPETVILDFNQHIMREEKESAYRKARLANHKVYLKTLEEKVPGSLSTYYFGPSNMKGGSYLWPVLANHSLGKESEKLFLNQLGLNSKISGVFSDKGPDYINNNDLLFVAYYFAFLTIDAFVYLLYRLVKGGQFGDININNSYDIFDQCFQIEDINSFLSVCGIISTKEHEAFMKKKKEIVSNKMPNVRNKLLKMMKENDWYIPPSEELAQKIRPKRPEIYVIKEDGHETSLGRYVLDLDPKIKMNVLSGNEKYSCGEHQNLKYVFRDPDTGNIWE